MPDLHIKCKTASVGGIKSRKDGVDANQQLTEPQFFVGRTPEHLLKEVYNPDALLEALRKLRD